MALACQELAKAILSAEWNSQACQTASDDLGSDVHWGLTMLPCYAMLGDYKPFFALFWGPPNMNSVGFLCLSILPNMGVVVVRTFLPMTKFR